MLATPCYGGHITDNIDRRLESTYLQEYIIPEMLDVDLEIGPTHALTRSRRLLVAAPRGGRFLPPLNLGHEKNERPTTDASRFPSSTSPTT